MSSSRDQCLRLCAVAKQIVYDARRLYVEILNDDEFYGFGEGKAERFLDDRLSTFLNLIESIEECVDSLPPASLQKALTKLDASTVKDVMVKFIEWRATRNTDFAIIYSRYIRNLSFFLRDQIFFFQQLLAGKAVSAPVISDPAANSFWQFAVGLKQRETVDVFGGYLYEHLKDMRERERDSKTKAKLVLPNLQAFTAVLRYADLETKNGFD